MNQNWKVYRRKGVSEMRPHIVGEDLTSVSVSEADKEAITQEGGMIARNPDKPEDQWYVNKAYFEKNMEEIQLEEAEAKEA